MSNAETVGVLSDTHLHDATPRLLALCERHFAGCARILHAGDVTEAAVLEVLGRRWRIEAVRGNMDLSPEVAGLPRRRLVTVGGLPIGLCHGAHPQSELHARLRAAFGEPPPQVIVHGHTHLATDETVDGVRFLNPGSPTDPRNAPYPSLARLTVNGGGVTFEIVPLG